MPAGVPPVVVMVVSDPQIAALLRPPLEAAGYGMMEASPDGIDLARIMAVCPDLLVLDLEGHRSEGLELCLRLRRSHPLPVIMLGDGAREHDRILALEIGADDFIAMPLSPRELVARVRAVLRRRPSDSPKIEPSPGGFARAWLRIDFAARTVLVAGQPLRLARRKFDLLRFLTTHPYTVHRRIDLLASVWEHARKVDARTVDAHIRSLRSVLEPQAAEPAIIVTVRGVGYRFNPDALDTMTPPRS